MGCTSNVFHANRYLESKPREFISAMLPAWGRVVELDEACERPVQLSKVGRAIQAHMRYRMAWRSDPEPTHAAARALALGWLKRKGEGVVISPAAVWRLRQAEAAVKRWRTRRLNILVRKVAAQVAAELG